MLLLIIAPGTNLSLLGLRLSANGPVTYQATVQDIQQGDQVTFDTETARVFGPDSRDATYVPYFFGFQGFPTTALYSDEENP